MEKITSTQNGQIKKLKKLTQKKYRKELGLFLVENLAIIFDAYQGGIIFSQLFVTESFAEKNAEKLKILNDGASDVYLVDEKVNKYFSELSSPSGIAAVYKIYEKKIDDEEPVVYLNGINDPGNLGTILRTSLAFGFKNIVVDSICAEVYNSKTIQAAKDSIFKLNIIKDGNNSWIKDTDLPIYVANVHEGKNLDNFKCDAPFCLVFGSESHGVDEKIIKLAKENIRIEMKGEIESLNVSTAAAIFLYKLKKIL